MKHKLLLLCGDWANVPSSNKEKYADILIPTQSIETELQMSNYGRNLVNTLKERSIVCFTNNPSVFAGIMLQILDLEDLGDKDITSQIEIEYYSSKSMFSLVMKPGAIITNWPSGFFDFLDKSTEQIVLAQYRRRKNDKGI